MTDVIKMGELLIRLAGNIYARNIYNHLKRIPVFNSLLHTIARHCIPYGTRVWIQVPAGLGKGLWLHLDPRYELNYWNGVHEPEIQNLLADYLRPGDVFYDIGAHIGFFSLIAARLVGKEGAVFAFEPDPENVKRIEEHMQRNELSQVQIVPLAVWSESGQHLCFQRASEFSSRNTGAVVQAPAPTGTDVVEVQTITLDDFARDHRPPTLLKVDVEGGECEVLKGARKILGTVRPMLILEVHGSANYEFIAEWLKARNYSMDVVSESPAFPKHLFAVP